MQIKQYQNRKLDIVNVSRDEYSENVWNDYLVITDVINSKVIYTIHSRYSRRMCQLN